MAAYTIRQQGASPSFPDRHPFLSGSTPGADIVIHLGTTLEPDQSKKAILIELKTECLGVHTGESAGREGSNVLGFARYRNGDDAPSDLVELVRQPLTEEKALEAARALFEQAGFKVAVCADQAGRIVDRLIRPKYNAALRFLDEGLASAHDMDITCRLGLGYPDGPIERVERGGLANHYRITKALFEVYGTPAYAPPRRALVAHQRKDT